MNLPCIAFVSAVESLSSSWWQVVLVSVMAFAGITLAWSTFRFRLMLENLKVPDEINPDQGLDYFQAMIAQGISSIKSHAEFSVGVVHSPEMGPDELSAFIRQRQRIDVDGVIRVNDWVGVIILGDSDGFNRVFERWSDELGVSLQGGASFFPDLARTSRELIEAAEEALAQVPAAETRLSWAELAEPDAPDDESEEDEELTADSSLDGLTGVLAMDKVASYMRKYIGEYRRKHSLALFFIGINGMADIDELHGKDAGDAVRKAVSELIQQALREEDVIGRYDDDEFLALMMCDEPHLAGIAKRIRDRSQQLLVIHHNRRIKVTVNIGVSMCPRHGRSLSALFSAAKGAYDIARGRQGSMCLIAGEQ